MENSIGDRIEEKYTRYLNCETDTLELTIEEAIFILETDESLHYVEDLLQEAYKVILSAYKKILKENGELRERIKQLEDTNKKLYEIGKEIGKQHKYTSENYIPVSLVEEKIEEIQKEYEETLKTANFKEIEKMNNINFRGITLEGQRSILRELLEKR